MECNDKRITDCRDIIEQYLRENRYGGLYDENGECACAVDHLFPCGENYLQCKPGYKVNCTPECEHDFTYSDEDWHIQEEKPESAPAGRV